MESYLDNGVDQDDSLCTECFESFLGSWLALIEVLFDFGQPFAHLVQIGFPVESTIGSVTMCPPADYAISEYRFDESCERNGSVLFVYGRRSMTDSFKSGH